MSNLVYEGLEGEMQTKVNLLYGINQLPNVDNCGKWLRIYDPRGDCRQMLITSGTLGNAYALTSIPLDTIDGGMFKKQNLTDPLIQIIYGGASKSLLLDNPAKFMFVFKPLSSDPKEQAIIDKLYPTKGCMPTTEGLDARVIENELAEETFVERVNWYENAIKNIDQEYSKKVDELAPLQWTGLVACNLDQRNLDKGWGQITGQATNDDGASWQYRRIHSQGLESDKWLDNTSARLNTLGNDDKLTKMFDNLAPYKNMKRVVWGAKFAKDDNGNFTIPYYQGMSRRIVSLKSDTNYETNYDMGGGVTNPFYNVMVNIDGFYHIMCDVKDTKSGIKYKVWAVGSQPFSIDPLKVIPWHRNDVVVEDIEVLTFTGVGGDANNTLYKGAFYPNSKAQDESLKSENKDKIIYSIPTLNQHKFTEIWDTGHYPATPYGTQNNDGTLTPTKDAKAKGFLYGAFLVGDTALKSQKKEYPISQGGYKPGNNKGLNNLSMRKLCTTLYNDMSKLWVQGDGLYTRPMSNNYYTRIMVHLLYTIEKGSMTPDVTADNIQVNFFSKWQVRYNSRESSSWGINTGATECLNNDTGVVMDGYLNGGFKYQTPALKASMGSYRGIEGIYGFVWEWIDATIYDQSMYLPILQDVKDDKGNVINQSFITYQDSKTKTDATYLQSHEKTTPYGNPSSNFDISKAVQFSRLSQSNGNIVDYQAGGFYPSANLSDTGHIGNITQYWQASGERSLYLGAGIYGYFPSFTWYADDAPSYSNWFHVPRLVVLP